MYLLAREKYNFDMKYNIVLQVLHILLSPNKLTLVKCSYTVIVQKASFFFFFTENAQKLFICLGLDFDLHIDLWLFCNTKITGVFPLSMYIMDVYTQNLSACRSTINTSMIVIVSASKGARNCYRIIRSEQIFGEPFHFC